jgi:CheY-like chemotaxis protein
MEGQTGVLEVKLENQVLIENGDPTIPPGDYVRLYVADTGRGIPPELMDRIFEPYFTTKPIGQGTGFGLSIVHGIVTGYDGFIRVASEVGQGTTFTIYLPKYTGTEKQTEVKEEALPRGVERILFIDDEEPLVKLAWKLLTGLGYKVVPSTDSLEALAVFKASSGTFDLLITDLMMPGMTGLELIQAVKAIQPEIPVILCTGHSQGVTKDRLKAAGVRELLIKPIEDAGLARTVRSVLDNKNY